jgi:hypothetical protein
VAALFGGFHQSAGRIEVAITRKQGNMHARLRVEKVAV